MKSKYAAVNKSKQMVGKCPYVSHAEKRPVRNDFFLTNVKPLFLLKTRFRNYVQRLHLVSAVQSAYPILLQAYPWSFSVNAQSGNYFISPFQLESCIAAIPCRPMLWFIEEGRTWSHFFLKAKITRISGY